jgi:pimeloyl-ACP methyl ester carboxylesterase
MREYVAKKGKYAYYTVELKPYAKNPELKKRFIERIKRDGFSAPVQYYHSLKDNAMIEDEKLLCNSTDDKKIDVPLLYIGQTGDWVCRTDLMIDAKYENLVPDLEEQVVKAGHWFLYEVPEELAGLVTDWLTRRFPAKKELLIKD